MFWYLVDDTSSDFLDVRPELADTLDYGFLLCGVGIGSKEDAVKENPDHGLIGERVAHESDGNKCDKDL